jgi:hypothetical protein
VRRARLAPEMISTPGQGVLRRRQRRALPAWFTCGRAQPLFQTNPRSTLSDAAQPVARALLDLAVLITRGSGLDEIGPFLQGIVGPGEGALG